MIDASAYLNVLGHKLDLQAQANTIFQKIQSIFGQYPSDIQKQKYTSLLSQLQTFRGALTDPDKQYLVDQMILLLQAQAQ